MRPGLLMSDNTLSLNRARTISPRPAVIYAQHYGRRVRKRREPNGAFAYTRQWLANETIRPMHHRDSPHPAVSVYLFIYLSMCLSFAYNPFLCLFSDILLLVLSLSFVQSSVLCSPVANSSSLTAYNFQSVITKEDVQAG